MVYCGPPSKGCSNCRDRKVRCDQKEPNCGQCEKRQQTCPGYRNIVDLMFRDESSLVIRRAKASKKSRNVPSTRMADLLPPLIKSETSQPATPPGPARRAFPITPSPLSTKIGEPKQATLQSRPHRRASASGDEHEGKVSPAPSLIFIPYPVPFQGLRTEGLAQQRAEEHSSPEEQQEKQEQHQQQPAVAHVRSLAQSPATITRPRTPSIDTLEPTDQERGTAFFFSRYVTVDENAGHHRFEFLYDIWKPNSSAAEKRTDTVLASMAAVGLVGISQLTHSEESIDSAHKSYGTALRLTNEALMKSEEAVRDTTMLSVLLLGVFEMMAKPGLKTMKTWQDHINGAVELAKLRGVSQFGTRAGIRMFNMLCESVAISCMQRQVPMPPELIALKNEMLRARVVPETDPAACGGIDLGKPTYKLLQARHDLLNTDLLDRLDDVLAQLDDIGAEFDRTIASVPPASYYKVIRVTKAHKAVFRDACYVYPSVATASVWNCLHASRILVLETILSAVQRHFPEPGEDGELVPQTYLAACRQAWAKIGWANMAIVASVPQNFGLLNPVHSYFDSLKPMAVGVAPLPTIEVRDTPTPPAQSPLSSAGSVQTPATTGYGDERGGDSSGDEIVFDDGGPSLENPTRARTVSEEAERHMVLASATNAVVWPLFVVGTSSVCSPQLKSYAVARLDAIFEETGLAQARIVASIVRQRERAKAPWLTLLQRNLSGRMPPLSGPGRATPLP